MRTPYMPHYVIMDMAHDFEVFNGRAHHPELPTIDVDASLSQVVEAVHYKDVIKEELNYLKERICEGEAFANAAVVDDMTNPYFEVEARSVKGLLDDVACSALAFGKHLHQQLTYQGLYEGNVLNYEYDTILPSGALILRRCV